MRLLKFLKRRHQRKLKAEKRDESFRYFNDPSEEIWENKFHELDKITTEHQKKKEILTYHQKPLKQISEIALNTPGKSKKQQHQKTIENLRKISRKN